MPKYIEYKPFNAAIVEFEEIARVNKSLENEENLGGFYDDLSAENESLKAEVSRLTSLLNQPPPVVEQPPPVVTPSTRDRLYVDGRTLRRMNGTPVRCGIESMYASGGSDPEKFFNAHKELGADIVSPLIQGKWLNGAQNISTHKRMLDAAETLDLVMGYNVDHMLQEGVGEPGRQWLKRESVAALLNSYDNVFIECEVELGSGMTVDGWRNEAIQLVTELRDAGHKSVIKVGSPFGGRRIVEVLQAGKDVLAVDDQVIFTWQAYWAKEARTPWSYQLDSGVTNGVAGTLEMCRKIRDSGLCFLVGIESHDNSGAQNGTGFELLAPELKACGIIWQWWVWNNGQDKTALATSAFGSITPMGRTVEALLKNA